MSKADKIVEKVVREWEGRTGEDPLAHELKWLDKKNKYERQFFVDSSEVSAMVYTELIALAVHATLTERGHKVESIARGIRTCRQRMCDERDGDPNA